MATKVSFPTKTPADRLYTWDELSSLPDQTVVEVVGDEDNDRRHLRLLITGSEFLVGFKTDRVTGVNPGYYESRPRIRFRVTNETCHVEFRV